MKDIIRMNQLAGIITEGQARKMMAILNENEENEENEEYNDIIKKLKSKYSPEGIEIKNNKIYFRTYNKNGNIKNYYTLEKMEDGDYRFAKGGIQKADWPIEKLLNYLLYSIID
jgi:hypothetical protein